jgi:hypothetical protein
MDTSFLSQASLCGVWGGQSGFGTGFCPSTLVSMHPHKYYFSIAQNFYVSHQPSTLYTFGHWWHCWITHFSFLDMEALVNYILELCDISSNNCTLTVPSLHTKRTQYIAQVSRHLNIAALLCWYLTHTHTHTRARARARTHTHIFISQKSVWCKICIEFGITSTFISICI